MTIKIKDSTIESSSCEKLSDATIDSNIADLCRETSQNIHALSTVASYITFDKKEHF